MNYCLFSAGRGFSDSFPEALLPLLFELPWRTTVSLEDPELLLRAEELVPEDCGLEEGAGLASEPDDLLSDDWLCTAGLEAGLLTAGLPCLAVEVEPERDLSLTVAG